MVAAVVVAEEEEEEAVRCVCLILSSMTGDV